MTTRRTGCWNATGDTRWKRFFSTSRAAAGIPARRTCKGQTAGGGTVTAVAAQTQTFSPRRVSRDGAALLVPAALVVGAAHRAHLLAGRADADVGLPADLYRPERQHLRARRRLVHRRGAAVGHPVPRPARLLDLVPGGDVRAQPRQPDDEPAAAGRSSSPRS